MIDLVSPTENAPNAFRVLDHLMFQGVQMQSSSLAVVYQKNGDYSEIANVSSEGK